MPTLVFKRLIVLERRKLLHDHHRNIFFDNRHVDDVQVVETFNHALIYTCPRSIPIRSKKRKNLVLFFVICCNTYLKFLAEYENVRSRFPGASIVLHDDRPRHGCAFVADRYPIHGCCTFHDQPSDVLDCVAKITQGLPAISPVAEIVLDGDHEAGCLRGKQILRDLDLYRLSDREWTCFRHFVEGGTVKKLAERLHLTSKTITNHKYNMMHKLQASTFIDLLKLARDWGFVD